uniref:Metal-binding protein n=1 Tax=Candidatus Methanophaga sp. ANME-1 ERB7 TaxID=2759913 RepID=A0A7G9Z5H5_9EURY|nr:hypothetical protein BHOFGHMF_00026 [Methanosarcinales archaeon ANME-1 ERB7]
MNCAGCKAKTCYKGKDCTKIAEDVKIVYKGDALNSLRVATRIESRYYMKKNRIEELILYAKEMNYKRLGVAFCIGMEKEAEIICDLLSQYFDVSSVCCKVCGIDKSYFELERLHKDAEEEAMCNPIGQAMILNNEKTDLNIILGLCIGHDTLFTKYSEAPVTTLAVKDRVLAHNPLGRDIFHVSSEQIGGRKQETLMAPMLS